MADLGKVDAEFFDRYVYPRLGAVRNDIAVGPAHGIDFGVLDPVAGSRGTPADDETAADRDGPAVVAATDPLSVLPSLGFERAGRFAVRICLADVAVSGIAPTHLAPSFALPADVDDESFAALWDAIHEECADLGVAVLTGHTARYPEATYPWVGAATVLGVGDRSRIVRPDGARPGDRLLVTNGPAVETTGLLSTLFPDAFPGLSAGTLSAAQSRLDDVGAVRDARTAVEAGAVTAMHDATEGGLRGALVEMAAAGDVGFEVESAAVPLGDGVAAVCDSLGFDPWTATTAGTLVIAVAPEDAASVAAALRGRGTPVGTVGRVTDGSGVTVDGESVESPDADPSWAAFERLSGE